MSEWWPLILWVTMGAGVTAGMVVEAINRDEHAFDDKFNMVFTPIVLMVIWPLIIVHTIGKKCKIAASNRRDRIGSFQREAALRTIGDEISEYDDGFHHRPNYRTRRRAERSQGPW